MAVKLADALVYLGVDDGGLAQGFDRASEKTKSWTAKLGGTATKLLGGVVVAGATAAVGAVLGIGAAAFSVSSQIDTATKKARTQLGLSADEAKEYGQAIKMVYARNVGESIEDVGQAIAAVRQGMHGLYQPSAEELGKLTEYAIGLRDAFDLDVNESVRAANQLVTQFGISGDEAFEIIAAGMQNGVNSADDLLDTLNEYAADFDDLGFTADQVLSTLNSGLNAGIYNTDKIGDAFREFKINMQDVGKVDAMRELNGEIADLMVAFSAGEITGVEAFDAIRKEMLKIQDPLKRQEIGVQLMGSLWEDLGGDAILAIDTLSDSLTENADVLGDLQAQYQTLPQFFEGLKRRAGVALAPLGDKLLEIANNAMPLLENAFTWLENELPGIVEGAAGFLDNLLKGAQDIYNLLFKGDFTGLFGLTEDDPIVGFLLDLRETAVSLVTDGFGFIKDWFTANWPTIQTIVANVWSAFQRIGSALIGMVGRIAGAFSGSFAPAGEGFVSFIQESLIPALEKWVPIILDQLVVGIETLAGWIAQVAEVVLPIFGKAWEFVSKHMNTILPILAIVGGAILLLTNPVLLVVAAIVALATAWGNNWGGIRDKTQNAIASVKAAVQSVIDFFTNNILPGLQRFFSIFDSIFQAFKSAFEGDWYAFGAHLREAFDKAVAFILDIQNRLAQKLAEAWERIVDRVVEFKDRMVETGKNLVRNFIATFTETDWGGVGKNILQGIRDGIVAGMQWVVDAALNVVSAATDAVKGFLGIHSASKVYAQIGKDSMGGFSKGITEMLPQVQATLTGGMGRLAWAGAAEMSRMSVTVNQYGMQFPADPRLAGDGAYRTVQALKAKGLFGSL